MSLVNIDKLDEIIVNAIDVSTNQVECQTLRWVLDKISELLVDEPSVQPQRPKGKYIYKNRKRLVDETDDGQIYVEEPWCTCSKCGGDYGFTKGEDAFCKFCGADMREEKE